VWESKFVIGTQKKINHFCLNKHTNIYLDFLLNAYKKLVAIIIICNFFIYSQKIMVILLFRNRNIFKENIKVIRLTQTSERVAILLRSFPLNLNCQLFFFSLYKFQSENKNDILFISLFLLTFFCFHSCFCLKTKFWNPKIWNVYFN
jgi:hypothetical protein